MKKFIMTNLVLLLAFSINPVFADVYKCQRSDGSVKFQDKPCRDKEKTLSHEKPPADILGGYKSCAELKERVYGKDNHMLENDIASFRWKRKDLDRALSHCGLSKKVLDTLE